MAWCGVYVDWLSNIGRKFELCTWVQLTYYLLFFLSGKLYIHIVPVKLGHLIYTQFVICNDLKPNILNYFLLVLLVNRSHLSIGKAFQCKICGSVQLLTMWKSANFLQRFMRKKLACKFYLSFKINVQKCSSTCWKVILTIIIVINNSELKSV